MNQKPTTEIYLDSNIYISIANRESNYDYTLAKLNNLKKINVIFPHAPPHAEEIAARINNDRGADLARRFINIIKKYNGDFGYSPGIPNLRECTKQINDLQSCLQENPELASAIKILITIRDKIQRGEKNATHFPTQLVKEDFYSCLERVYRHLDLTDFARQNDVHLLGRRNEKTLVQNFRNINKDHRKIETFEEIRRKFGLTPRHLSNIEPADIFKDPKFLKFIQEAFILQGEDFDKIPRGNALIKSHYQKESIITLILNSMEKAGYSQEHKNHDAALTSRLHDVSHAIYASRADYFITNDARFSRKVAATFLHLGLPTKVMNQESFLTLDTSSTSRINWTL